MGVGAMAAGCLTSGVVTIGPCLSEVGEVFLLATLLGFGLGVPCLVAAGGVTAWRKLRQRSSEQVP